MDHHGAGKVGAQRGGVARLHGILRGAYPPPAGNPLWSRVGFGNWVCDFSEGRLDGTRLQEGIPDVSWDGGAAGAAECAQQGAAGGGVEKGESERGGSPQAVEQGRDERAEESPGGVSQDESQEGIEVMAGRRTDRRGAKTKERGVPDQADRMLDASTWADVLAQWKKEKESK